MKKYNTYLFFLAALVLLFVHCSDSSLSTQEERGEIVRPIEPPIAPDVSKLSELERQLDTVKSAISKKESEYLSFTGDATRATMISTKADAGDELAQERAELSLQSAKEKKSELDELKNKQAEIELAIDSLQR